MNLRPQHRESPEINLTPLIDVVFLLLIFFMVSTTFKHEAALKVELPEASAKPAQAPEKKLEILIDVQGRYFLDQKELVNTRPETLRRALQQLAGGRTDQPLVIRADGKTPHQAVVTAMDVAGQLGFSQLSIATVKSTESPQ